MKKLFEEMDNKDFEQLVDSVPKNDLKNLVKSAGIDLDGTESEDELRGMYKAASAIDESLNRRLYKLAKVNEGYRKTEGGPVNPAGCQITMILKYGELTNPEKIIEILEKTYKTSANRDFSVEDISYMELPKSYLEDYTYKHDVLDSDLTPDIVDDEHTEDSVEIIIESNNRKPRSRFVK